MHISDECYFMSIIYSNLGAYENLLNTIIHPQLHINKTELRQPGSYWYDVNLPTWLRLSIKLHSLVNSIQWIDANFWSDLYSALYNW